MTPLNWMNNTQARIQMTEYQEAVFVDAPKKYRTILMPCGRRVGKTAGGLISSVRYLLNHRGPGLWISTNFSNIAKHQQKFLTPLLKRFPDSSYTINTRHMKFKAGGADMSLDFASATRPEMIEGHGYRFIMVDEAGIVFRRDSGEDLYKSTLLPMLMDYSDSRIFLLGTPKGTGGLYHELHNKSQKGIPGYFSRTVSSYDNPFFTKDQVDNATLELQGSYREQEVFGQFVSGAESLVTHEDIIRVKEIPNNITRITMGVDFASSQKDSADSTGIVILGQDDQGLITVIYVEELKAKFNILLKRIQDLAEQYHPDMIGVEDTTFQVWAGQELVRTTNLPIQFIRPSRKANDFIGGSSKEYRFIPVAAKYHAKLIQHHQALYPGFENQLFQFPAVDHDDMIDALVIAVSLFNREKGNLSAFSEEPDALTLSPTNETCGGCSWFDNGQCKLRSFSVDARERACSSWQALDTHQLFNTRNL